MKMKSETAVPRIARRLCASAIRNVSGLYTASVAVMLAISPAAAEAPREGDSGSCRFHLPDHVLTLVYDTYGGGAKSKYRLADASKARLGRQAIRVPKKDAPIFLILSAYDPTEWDLRIEPGAEITAILAIGYHEQIVSNVPPNAEIGFSSYSGDAGVDCPKDVNWDQDLLAKLNPMLDREFSRTVETHYSASSGKCEMMACGDDGHFATNEPGAVTAPPGSFWSRLFGAKAPPPPTPTGSGIVRSSAPYIAR
jgi:hypothetical protein